MFVFDPKSSRKIPAEATLDLSVFQNKNPSFSPTSFSVHGQIPRVITGSLPSKQRVLQIASLFPHVPGLNSCPWFMPGLFTIMGSWVPWESLEGLQFGVQVGSARLPRVYGFGTLKIHFLEDQGFVSVSKCSICKLCPKVGLLWMQPGNTGKVHKGPDL